MIYSIEGEISSKGKRFIILKVNSISFKIFCSPSTLKRISPKKRVKIFTNLILEREKFQLYGFLSPKELELFDILNEIPGIGTKSALILSSFGSLEKLKEAIESEKEREKFKGIGKKRLQRIRLEITGKIKEIKEESREKIEKRNEVLEALKSLGFSKKEAKDALSKIPPEIKDSKEIIKTALKILGRQ